MENWTLYEWAYHYAFSVLAVQALVSLFLAKSGKTSSKDALAATVMVMFWPVIVTALLLGMVTTFEVTLFTREQNIPKPSTRMPPNMPEPDEVTKDVLETYHSTLDVCVTALGEYGEGPQGAKAINTLAMVESTWRAFHARRTQPK